MKFAALHRRAKKARERLAFEMVRKWNGKKREVKWSYLNIDCASLPETTKAGIIPCQILASQVWLPNCLKLLLAPKG